MRTETEGIILKRRKISEKTQMITLFTKELGKITAGTNLSEGRLRNQPALHAFTYGRSELNKSRDNFFINKAETIKNYYSLAENPDKYMQACYVLEFTDKILEEECREPGVYAALRDFLTMLESRDRGIGTLILAYQTKAIKYLGHEPVLDRCASCGSRENLYKFSVEAGGTICRECFENAEESMSPALIYNLKFDIVKILKYFADNPLAKLENVALTEEAGRQMQSLVRSYAEYYLDASDIKSEGLI